MLLIQKASYFSFFRDKHKIVFTSNICSQKSH